MSRNSDKSLLIGKKEIMDRFGLSEYVFNAFVRLGLPVRKINNRLYGHADHIDNFFKHITAPGDPIKVDSENIPDLEENGD